MIENKVCADCKYSRQFPVPYTLICDYKFTKNVKMRYEDILECDKKEAK